MKTNQDVSIPRNTDHQLGDDTIQILEGSGPNAGDPVDLNSAELRWQVFDDYQALHNGEDPLIECITIQGQGPQTSLNSEINILDPTTGEIEIIIDAEQTDRTPEEYFHRLRLIDGDGVSAHVFSGDFIIRP